MTVTIPTSLESYVQNQLSSGRFDSEQDLVAEALRFFREVEQQQSNIVSSIEQARQDHDKGRFVTLRNEVEIRAFVDEIAARGRKILDSARTS